jgi:hypothetical protein
VHAADTGRRREKVCSSIEVVGQDPVDTLLA